MNFSAIERVIQPYLYPLWVEARRVRHARRLNFAPVSMLTASPRRLFVDMSVISKHDARTGIQRVVRAIAAELQKGHTEGWSVQFVAADKNKEFHAINWPLSDKESVSMPSMEARPGDIFLGLDYSLYAICRYERQLLKFKKQGGRIWFLVHDLLPVQRPEWFSDKTVVRYRHWLRVIASLGDGYFCNSQQTQFELSRELNRRYGVVDGFCLEVLPMGWDIATSCPSQGIPTGFNDFLAELASRNTLLMVGTLEPRKGHAEVLAACELLWRNGREFNLVIVGRPGWKTKNLQEFLLAHPRLNKNIFWLQDASDEALQKLYTACDGVIIASHAEGFGLPLIEAVGYGKPALVRDLQVFRTMPNSTLVTYFDKEAGAIGLAKSVDEWMCNLKPSTLSLTSMQKLGTWKEAAEKIFLSVALFN